MHPPSSPPNRRSFLEFATHGLGALFAAILGAPAVGYLLDPVRRPIRASDFRLVEGVRLDQLRENEPVQGAIRASRRDGWTLHPSDVIGRVWVVKRRAGAFDIERLRTANQADRDSELLVMTTICPHLGCSVNYNGTNFACPCHSAEFEKTGDRRDSEQHQNPALRGMDSLEWQIDAEDPQRIVVRYQRFKTSIAEKVVTG